MKKEEIELLVNKGMSTRKMGKHFGMSQTGIVHWLKKFNLVTERTRGFCYIKNNIKFRICSQCKEHKEINTENFIMRKNNRCYSICKECKYKAQRARKSDIKQQCIEYKGGKCQNCDYNKCQAALEFHHLDPNEKDFDICQMAEHKFEFLKKELDKCICLCANCHREIHAGLIDISSFQ